MSPTTDVDALVQRIRRAAAELRSAGYTGLPAEMETTADALDAQRQLIAAYDQACARAARDENPADFAEARASATPPSGPAGRVADALDTIAGLTLVAAPAIALCAL